jgi:hypothetical protein
VVLFAGDCGLRAQPFDCCGNTKGTTMLPLRTQVLAQAQGESQPFPISDVIWVLLVCAWIGYLVYNDEITMKQVGIGALVIAGLLVVFALFHAGSIGCILAFFGVVIVLVVKTFGGDLAIR